jgi:hypothetical protein
MSENQTDFVVESQAADGRTLLVDVDDFLDELPGVSAEQLLTETPEEIEWLVPGLLAPGWTIKIAAREKTGKGTFVFYLLGCLERGDETCLGAGTGRPTSAVVLTEEPTEALREKVAAFGLQRAYILQGSHLIGTWKEKVELLALVAQVLGHDIVFIDNISRSAGVEDEAGMEMARACETFMDMVQSRGLAGIIDHHHRKASGSPEDMSRGTTALAGATDVNVEMFRDKKGGWMSRRRRLVARGRTRATIWEKWVELSEDGKSYEVTEGGAEHQLTADFGVLALQLGGETTAKEFSKARGLSLNMAKRRLMALVECDVEGIEVECDVSGKAHVWRVKQLA